MKWHDIRWPVCFAAGCIAIVGVVLFGLWLSGLFRSLGLSTNGIIALSLGVAFTVFVGVGLMALVFYSGRRQGDETLHIVHDDIPSATDTEPSAQAPTQDRAARTGK